MRDAGINGPSYTVLRNFIVNIVISYQPPTIGAYNLSVPELSPQGTYIANVSGVSANFQTGLSYTLAPTTFMANFPFDISSSNGVGTISVGPGAVLLFGPGPRQYVCTLTVCDNNPLGAMYASSVVTLDVTYVPMPPYFNAVTQVPNSMWFQLEVCNNVVQLATTKMRMLLPRLLFIHRLRRTRHQELLFSLLLGLVLSWLIQRTRGLF